MFIATILLLNHFSNRHKEKIMFFGHSHKRLFFQKMTDFRVFENYLHIKSLFHLINQENPVDEGLYLINPNALSKTRLPWCFNERTSYVVYDSEKRSIVFK